MGGGYIQIHGAFIMSCKLKGKDTGIENVPSHQKTLDLIGKEIKSLHLFVRTETYHSKFWMATTIMSIVILPILFLVLLLIFSLVFLHLSEKRKTS